MQLFTDYPKEKGWKTIRSKSSEKNLHCCCFLEKMKSVHLSVKWWDSEVMHKMTRRETFQYLLRADHSRRLKLLAF